MMALHVNYFAFEMFFLGWRHDVSIKIMVDSLKRKFQRESQRKDLPPQTTTSYNTITNQQQTPTTKTANSSKRTTRCEFA